jgi:hypothetical protein
VEVDMTRKKKIIIGLFTLVFSTKILIDRSIFAAPQTAQSPNSSEESLRLKRDHFYKSFTFGLPSLDQLDGGEITDCFAPGVRERLSLEAKTIVIGKITNQHAFFSKDRRNAYTEFSFMVEQVIKAETKQPIKVDEMLTTSRWGGKILLSSGRVQDWLIRGLGMPMAGNRYLLFLEDHQDEAMFYILTGYEFGAEGIKPIDSLDAKVLSFSSYKGSDEQEFIRIIKEAIVK